MENFKEQLLLFFQTTGIKIGWLLFTLVIGVVAIKLFSKLLKQIFFKSSMENTLATFIVSLVRFAMYLLLLFILAKILEVNTTGLIAVLGAAGLAVGLALQDSLSNLANGIVIIVTKPFKEGDMVEIGGVTAKVKSIRMLVTELITVDNKKIIMPNREVINKAIINYTARPTRRIDLKIGVSYNTDIAKCKEIIKYTLECDNRVLAMPECAINISEYSESSVTLFLRFWVPTEKYWDVYFDTQDSIFQAFKTYGIEIPFPQVDVHMKPVLANPKFKEFKRPPKKEIQYMPLTDADDKKQDATGDKNETASKASEGVKITKNKAVASEVVKSISVTKSKGKAVAKKTDLAGAEKKPTKKN